MKRKHAPDPFPWRFPEREVDATWRLIGWYVACLGVIAAIVLAVV